MENTEVQESVSLDDFSFLEDVSKEEVGIPEGLDPSFSRGEEPVADEPVDDDPAEGDEPATDADPPVADGDESDNPAPEPVNEGPIYDPTRDYPGEKGLSPNVFKNRESLNQGLIAKVSYIEKLNKDLQENGSSLGALPLPEGYQTIEELDEAFNLDTVNTYDDDQAKKSVYEMDRLIRDMKVKLERVSTEKQVQQTSVEYEAFRKEAGDHVAATAKEFGFNVNDIVSLTDADYLSKLAESIQKFEDDGENFIADNGYANFRDELSRKVTMRNRLAEMMQKSTDFQSKLQKSTTSDGPTPEQIKSAYKEFKLDLPELDVFQNGDHEAAFLREVARKGWPASTPREWAETYYNKYLPAVRQRVAQVQKQRIIKTKDKGAPERKQSRTVRAPEGKIPTWKAIDDNWDKILK